MRRHSGFETGSAVKVGGDMQPTKGSTEEAGGRVQKRHTGPAERLVLP